MYGSAGHQLGSRLYLDFLRMEGESNFLLLLPQGARQPIAERWYRGAADEARKYLVGRSAGVDAPSAIEYRTKDPQRELYGLLRQRLAPVLGDRFDLSSVPDARLRRQLQSLSAVRGASLAWLPEMAVLRVESTSGAPKYFTLLRNTAHLNVTHLAREKAELVPAENTLTVVPGFIGAYPNAMYRVQDTELPTLEAAVRGLASEAGYRALADRFAVRRTSAAFWAASDALHGAHRESTPLEAGLFDFNRLENR